MAYPLIEFYYPMVTLTKEKEKIKVVSEFYFINNETNTQLNFAYKKSLDHDVIKGTAKEYYIYNDDATKYLVILHNSSSTDFYVAFPLTPVKTVSDYLKKDRMNGGLAKSFNNLSNSSNKINFSLESVIDSMQSFNPTECRYDTNIYLIDEPIYVDETVFTNIKFAKNPNLTMDTVFVKNMKRITNVTIKQVSKVSKCTTTKKVDNSKKGLFSGLNETEQTNNNYLNLALMLSGLLYFIFFFWIYYSTDVFNGDKRMSIVLFITITMMLLLIPVGITVEIYNSNANTKINNNELRTSITVARYSVVVFALTMFTIFSKKIIEILSGYKNAWAAFLHWISNIGNNKMAILPIICGGLVFYYSYIIFLKV